MVTPFIQWNVRLNHSFNGATDGDTHVEGTSKNKLAVERMVTPFILWNVWLNRSFDGANDGETHAEGYLKKIP